MSTVVHRAYVISDLHLGGRFPRSPNDRGFRMMDRPDALASFIRALAGKPTQPTIELVINGDFLDFLAEETGPGTWKAFRDEPGEAVTAFEALAARPDDGEVFDALASLLDAGHRLTILLGNHDIELSWPEVRAAFERRLWVQKKTQHFNVRWIHDGEALILGDALIEHGNRYDPANFVDHERLRQVRELRSRRLYSREEDIFRPPVGSRLVAEIMNPIKKDYPFIDLLKPESEPLFGLLLALDPSKREYLMELAALLVRAPVNMFEPAADPGYRQRIRGSSPVDGVTRARIAGGGAAESDDAALVALLARALPADQVGHASESLATIPREDNEIVRGNVASIGEKVKAWWSLIRLIGTKADDQVKKRIPLLRDAIRALRGDQSFDEKVETGKRYLRAATQLASGEHGRRRGGEAPVGFRYVIFGHTHHRKKLALENGATYINTGTWAKLMKFPAGLVSDDDAVAAVVLQSFLHDVRTGSYDTEFVPTYARVDLRDDDRVDTVELCTFDPQLARVE